MRGNNTMKKPKINQPTRAQLRKQVEGLQYQNEELQRKLCQSEHACAWLKHDLNRYKSFFNVRVLDHAPKSHQFMDKVCVELCVSRCVAPYAEPKAISAFVTDNIMDMLRKCGPV